MSAYKSIFRDGKFWLLRQISLNVAMIVSLFACGFIAITVGSILLEYSPSRMAVYILKYGFFGVLTTLYLFMIFIAKSKWNKGKTVWQLLGNNYDRVKALVSGPLLILMLALFMDRCMAYPTKLFADNFFVSEMKCISAWKLGKSRRNSVTIKAVGMNKDEYLEFPWRKDLAPECPGDIEVRGYSWFWGAYIVSVKSLEN